MHPKYWKLGRKVVYQSPADGDATGGGGPLDVHAAGDALAALMGDDEPDGAAQDEVTQETPEAAAERIAAEEAGANQEADAEGEQGDTYDENETVTVMIDGKPVELTKAQIAEAKKGELRQADYTRKTQEAAEQRKAAEAEKAQARAQREQYAQQLQQVLAANQFHDQQAQQWTPEAIEADPIGYMQFKHAADARAVQNQQAQAQLQEIQQQEQQERQQAARDHQAQQLEAIRAKLPAWKDEAVMKAEIGEIKQWLFGQGFTDNDLAGMQDHRMVLLARSAMQHEKLLTRAKDTAQKVAKVPPKVTPPGRVPIAPTDGRTVAMKQLKASGSISAAANAFSLLL